VWASAPVSCGTMSLRDPSLTESAIVNPAPHAGSLREVAAVFLRLGCTAFGGPAAHVAMMRREMVEQRQWLSEQDFLDLFGAANLIPGPSSTELAILLGYRRAGWRALILAGVLFILPAMLLVLAFAWAYVRYGTLPAAEHLLYGVKPVVIAIIALALWGLRRTALRGPSHFAVAALAGTLLLVGINPLPLFVGGAALLVARSVGSRLRRDRSAVASLLPLAALRSTRFLGAARPLPGRIGLVAAAAGVATAGAAATGTTAHYRPLTLFLTFLKIGAVLYGSGYVLLAFLRDDFVTHLHWLTNQQLVDAVAVGQFTPGPVFTTATFVGYLTGGWGGALLATVAIFLPSFFFCAVVLRIVPLTRRSAVVRAALDGVNAAAIGLMAAVTLQLGKAAIIDIPSAVIGAAALALLLRFRWNSAWFILGGALCGLVVKGVA